MTSYGSKLRHAPVSVATSKSSSCLLIISENRENGGHEDFFREKVAFVLFEPIIDCFHSYINEKH